MAPRSVPVVVGSRHSSGGRRRHVERRCHGSDPSVDDVTPRYSGHARPSGATLAVARGRRGSRVDVFEMQLSHAACHLTTVTCGSRPRRRSLVPLFPAFVTAMSPACLLYLLPFSRRRTSGRIVLPFAPNTRHRIMSRRIDRSNSTRRSSSTRRLFAPFYYQRSPQPFSPASGVRL